MLQMSPKSEVVHPVDQVPPPRQLAVLGLQHVLVMYAGAVAVPLIVGHALGLAAGDIAFLVSADLFACGLASLVQSLGLPGFGVRLPVMMGVTFASVAPMLALIAAGKAAGAPQAQTLQVIYGSVIAAGVFGVAAAPLIGRMARLFPPVVTGTVILTIGISLMRIGIDWAAGGQASAPDYGAPANLGIAAFVLVAILGLMRFAQGFLRNIAVLVGLALGVGLCLGLGRMSLDAVAQAPWLRLVGPFHFGLPRLELVPAATMCLVMLVVMIESFGMFMALGAMVGRPLDTRTLANGLRADGLGAILGGVFNTFPYTSFSQNVGLVGVTGVTSRYVCAAGGAIMLALSVSPKLGALVAAVPPAVLGGAGLVMFGMVLATGVRVLSEADLAADRHNALIVAVSVGLGMIPVVSDKFFQAMPAALGPLLHSGILLATLAAVALNLAFNGLKAR
ncbi:MAG: purine permease [Caulobacterales bacterium]|nr:purine permease [Caulobacterales bacterium]